MTEFQQQQVNDNQINIMRVFLDEVNTRGTICRSDVVSLESYLDSKVISDSLALNKFPEERMRMNVKEVNTILTNKIDSLHKPLTLPDVIADLRLLKGAIDTYIDKLSSLTNPGPLIDVLMAPDIKYVYDKNSLAGGPVNTQESNILELLTTNTEWVFHLADILANGNSTNRSNIIDFLKYAPHYASPVSEKVDEPFKTPMFAPTLSLLLNKDNADNEYTTEIFTVKRVEDFIKHVTEYQANLKSFAEVLTNDIAALEQGGEDAGVYQRSNWDTIYDKYPICKYIIDDHVSMYLLNCLVVVANAKDILGAGEEEELNTVGANVIEEPKQDDFLD